MHRVQNHSHQSDPASAFSRTAFSRSSPSRRALLQGAALVGGTAATAALTAGPALAASGASASRDQRIAAFSLAREVADNRTDQALSASDLNPSGFYLAPNTELTVTVFSASADEHLLIVGAPDAEVDEDKRTPREYALQVGENTVSDPHGGPIYWTVIGESGNLRAAIGEAAVRMPFFIHGSTSETQFQDQLDTRDTPYVELVSSHAMVTVYREAALRYRGQDHATLLETFEDIISTEDELAGMDDATEVHARLDHRYHFVTRAAGIEDIGAYATHGHMLFPAPIVYQLLTVDRLRLDGWGVYHELGHQHQQTVYKPSALTESTVNWYSLAVNRKFAALYGQAPRLHVPEESNGETVWSSAIPLVGTSGVDFLESFSVMEQLVMYEQLRLAYGDQLYPDVHRLVREEKPDSGDDTDNDYRLGMLVYYLSKAAGEDLREFAAAWGVHYSAQIESEIEALGLPAPEQDLTAIRDEDGQTRAARVLASPSLRRANGIPDDVGR